MSQESARFRFSLRDLFVVITGIGVLLALLVPWIQASRESARKTRCNNELHWIAIALLNYHDNYKVLPMGAMHAGPNPGGDRPVNAALGPSWWYGTLIYMQERVIYDPIAQTQQSGGTAKHQFCANDMHAAGISLNAFMSEDVRCPSSPLSVTETPNGTICLPTYVGIAGGCDIDPDSQDYQVNVGAAAGPVAPKTNHVYHNTHKGTGAAVGSIFTPSGMLPPCQHVRLADCVDGTSNTMIVAEQSGWLLDQNSSSSKEYHGDPGWTVGGTGPGGGWLSGTRRVDPVPKVDKPGGPPAIWGADCWNITTVRYPPNFKRVMGATPLPGCSENHGINNPLQSPHPGGLLVGMADGSVQFISEKTALEVLLRMAIRDDGQPAKPKD